MKNKKSNDANTGEDDCGSSGYNSDNGGEKVNKNIKVVISHRNDTKKIKNALTSPVIIKNRS